MAEDANKVEGKAAVATTGDGAIPAESGEHYEQIAEYRIGEGPPPLPLIIIFVLIVLWACFSWIPFFGY